LNHADTINILSGDVIKLTILDQSAGHNAGSLKAHPSNSVSQSFHRSALTLVSFLSWAVATVVTVLATETTLAFYTTLFTSGTSSKTLAVLLKAAGVPVADVLVIINVVNLVVVFDTVGCLLLFLKGLKPTAAPNFRIRLNAILSTDLEDLLIRSFDLRTGTTIVTVLTASRTLISAITHNSISLTSYIITDREYVKFLFGFNSLLFL
jgi:hypothetical protein